jgi:hypothetical protein
MAKSGLGNLRKTKIAVNLPHGNMLTPLKQHLFFLSPISFWLPQPVFRGICIGDGGGNLAQRDCHAILGFLKEINCLPSWEWRTALRRQPKP